MKLRQKQMKSNETHIEL